MFFSEQFIYFRLLVYLVLIVGFFYPFSNWLWIYKYRKEYEQWEKWLSNKPSYEEYCAVYKSTSADEKKLSCHFCQGDRQYSKLEKVIPQQFKFGLINNVISGEVHYKSTFCSRCNMELYRTKHVK